MCRKRDVRLSDDMTSTGSISPSNDAARYYVDFDHTLLRSNSTQELLRLARPFVLLWPILLVISLVMRLTGVSARTRFIWEDALKVRILRLLNPRVFGRFEKGASEIAADRLNTEVMNRLKDVPQEQITIVSFGFLPVIRSLLSQTDFAACQIVAPEFGAGPSTRRAGKLAMLARHGLEPRRQDVVITDNLVDDADLVSVVDHVHEVEADHSSYVYPQPYLPFFYTAKIKRSPGFFIKQVLLEELPIVLLAFGLTTMSFNPGLWAGLILLFLAMILSYELGYAENDRVGQQKEEAPKLTANFYRYRSYPMLPHAWIYAGVLTLVGILILGPANREAALSGLGLSSELATWQSVALLSAVWMSILVLARLVFWAFNHASLIYRVYIYAPLHIVKYLGFLVLFPATVIGLLLVYAHIVRTWSLYAVRRAGGNIDFLWSQIIRTVFFLFGLGLIAYVNFSAILTWQTAIIVVFCVVRAVPEMMRKPRNG